MHSFIHNHRGAVTVFITLLLIPAVLISGTAVDVARIYAARGVVQNANQLAANSALADYDALLKDLYGLYAITRTDEELGAAVDLYIRASVFGEDISDAQLGDLRLFGGSSGFTATVKPVDGANLSKVEILRRQIEEYAKLRAPIIILKDVIGRIEQFSKLKNDAEAITTKLEVDDEFAKIVEDYKELYLRLRYNDYYLLSNHREEFEIKLIDDINAKFGEIKIRFQNMLTLVGDYWSALDEYNDLLGNPPADDAEDDVVDAYLERLYELEEDVEDAADAFQNEEGYIAFYGGEIQDYIDNALRSHSNNYYQNTTGYRLDDYVNNLTKLQDLCEKIGDNKNDLLTKIAGLRTKLDDCSDELKTQLLASLDEYEPLIEKINKNTCDALYAPNAAYLSALNDFLSNDIGYGELVNNRPDYPNAISLSTLAVNPLTYTIDQIYNDPLQTGESGEAEYLRLESLANCTGYQYAYFHDTRTPIMKKFVDLTVSADGVDGEDIYATLAMLYGTDNGSDNEGEKKTMQKAINDICGEAQTTLSGFTFLPRGASEIPANVASELSGLGASYEDPLEGDDWDKAGENNKAGQNVLKKAQSFFADLANLFGDAGDKILLLAYDSEMFSNYATQYKKDAETMAGVPYGLKVNYFLDSEQEYLFFGSHNAAANLAAVSGLLLMTRFVFNYISTFMIPSVKATLLSIQAAFAWTGPFSLVIRELARVGLALAESALDVAALRSGGEIPLLKTRDPQWKFGIGTLVGLAEDLLQEAVDTAVATMKQVLLDKLAEIQTAWNNAAGHVTEQLNRAEKIDEVVFSLTGESLGISELQSGFDSLNNNVSDIISGTISDAESFEPPVISFDPDNAGNDGVTLEDVQNGDVELKPELAFGYTDYLRIYLLFVPGDVLAKRTAQLIALNLTNYNEKICSTIGSDSANLIQRIGKGDDMAEAMEAAADKLYDMSEAHTAISVQTDLELRFMFLTMAFFQMEREGAVVRPPQSFVVSETDYRGY